MSIYETFKECDDLNSSFVVEPNDLTDTNFLMSAEVLSLRLNRKHHVHPSICIAYYLQRIKEAWQSFNEEESIVFCCDIEEVLQHLGIISYNPNVCITS